MLNILEFIRPNGLVITILYSAYLSALSSWYDPLFFWETLEEGPYSHSLILDVT